MAIVNVTIIEGREQAVKTQLIERITAAVVETLDAEPRQVRVVINEVKDGAYGVAGQPIFLHPPKG